VEKDKVKEISILLGAGFSKSLAGLPLARELSSDVLKAFKNDSRLKERFENTKEGNFNYEKFAQYLGNIREQSSFRTELGLDFISLDDNEREKLNLCEEILYKTLLDKLLSVDYAEKFKKRQKSFLGVPKLWLPTTTMLVAGAFALDAVLRRIVKKHGNSCCERLRREILLLRP
jgi:hypothetical protein